LLQRFDEHNGLNVVGNVVTTGVLAREIKNKISDEIFSIIYRHMMVVDFDNEDHNMDKDMSKHNHQLNVGYIHHH
jgi:hypothetical protein